MVILVKNVVCQMVPEVGFDAARPCQEVVFGVPNAARKGWRDLFFAMRYEVIKVLDRIEYMFYNIKGIIQEVGKFVKFKYFNYLI